MNQRSDNPQEKALDNVLASYLIAIEEGNATEAARIIETYPQYKSEIQKFAENKQLIDRIARTRWRKPQADSGNVTQSVSGSGGFIPPSAAELQKQFDQFEIIELLGNGAMGAVYKSRQSKLDRMVALKILAPQSANDREFVDRFEREARAMARLVHPNIVTIFDFGEIDGLCYLVMEFVDGVNLRQSMQHSDITPLQALQIVPQICDALNYAHQQGVVHRDIKPENILLDRQGSVKIADFGLAKVLDDKSARHFLTATQQVLGTFRYMAPEQLEGSRDVDHRADIYSLGVVFYELLTGQLPIGRFELPSETANVDSRLDDVVSRTLERSPDRRYQQASEVKTEINLISSGETPAESELSKAKPPKTIFKSNTTVDYFQFPVANIVLILVAVAALVLPFAPWSMTEISHAESPSWSFSSTGFQHELAWFGWLMTLVLLGWLVVTIQSVHAFGRSLLIIGAGLALAHASLYLIMFGPLPADSEQYTNFGNRIRTSGGSEIVRQYLMNGRLTISSFPRAIVWFAALMGVILAVAGRLEIKSSAYWHREMAKPEPDAVSFRLPGIALQLVGWSALVFALIAWLFVIVVEPLGGHYARMDARSFRTGGFWTGFFHTIYALFFAPIIILAGRAMSRTRHRRLAVTGCVLAMIPLNYAAAVGIPVGILGLFLLYRSPSTAKLFKSSPVEVSQAKWSLRVVGGIHLSCAIFSVLLFCVTGLMFYQWAASRGAWPGLTGVISIFALVQNDTSDAMQTTALDSPWAWEFPAALLLILACVVLSGVYAYASYQLLRLRSFGWARVAIIIGLIPFTYSWFVSCPASLWAIHFMRQKFVGGKPELQTASDLFETSPKK